MRIRNVEMSDAEIVWAWRNSTDARVNSKNNSLISLEEHVSWMASRIVNLSENPFWICESGNSPIGYLRLDSTHAENNHFVVSIFVAEKFRGVGLGKGLIKLAIKELQGMSEHFVIQAEVLKINKSSLAMFNSLEFSLVLDTHDRQILVYDSSER